MRVTKKSFIFLLYLACAYACKKDARIVILNLKQNCIIASDSISIAGKNDYTTYQFENNTNRLKVAKRIVGNGIMQLYREVHYHSNNLPDKTITYTNANEYYETKFFYTNGSSVPYKTELYFTSRGNGQPSKNFSRFQFRYDENNRLKEVKYMTTKGGEKEYTMQIHYNEKDNVSKLLYEISKGATRTDTLITASAFDDKPNPYSMLPYWEFLMLDDNWDSDDAEPIITALSRNNPLDLAIGQGKRDMLYTYNQTGFPLTRTNINKHHSGQHSFKESFTYLCP